MFFSNVVQFSRSYPLPLSSTASLLYHPLLPLSTPFSNLFFIPALHPCVSRKSFNFLWKIHRPVFIYIIYVIYFVIPTVFLCFYGKMHNKMCRDSGVRPAKTLSITFSCVPLEIFVRMIYNNCHSVCACSSVDRAPASGAGCVGSIPVRRTKSTSLHCREVLFLPCSKPCSTRAQIIFRAQKHFNSENAACSSAFSTLDCKSTGAV